jgi:hypothetical protein
MMKNPMVYGISYDEKVRRGKKKRRKKTPNKTALTLYLKGIDPTLDKKRRDLILEAAKKLDMCQMIRFAENSETLSMTDLGRIASYYYIEHESIMMYLDTITSQRYFIYISSKKF